MEKKILWVSYRPMPEEAYVGLKRIYGEVAVEWFNGYDMEEDGFMSWDWEEILRHSEGFDIIAIDHSAVWGNDTVYEELTKPTNNTKPVIRNKVSYHTDENGRHSEHSWWEQIIVSIKEL